MGRPIEGNVFDVATGEIFPGRIGHKGGYITGVDRISGTFSGVLTPGLIDSHIHIDSSLLCPSRFAQAVVPRGTTAVVTDPHEIANVCGMAGIAYMMEDAAAVPLRVYFTAPSCVPATPFETAGAALGPEDIESLLALPDVVALGEMMNYHGAVERDPDVMAKIMAARRAGKPVDGHCPMLSGKALREYAALGISTDHECTSALEALEKHTLGMNVMVREGSAAKNLASLAPFAMQHDFFLVSDDVQAPDLLRGHIDAALAKAVSLGIDPLHAVRAATILPASHYRLPLGAIVPGRRADIIKVSDLTTFHVEEVYIGGTLVAAASKSFFFPHPVPIARAFPVEPKSSAEFTVPASGAAVSARVIRVIPRQILTGSETARLRVEEGRAQPDPGRDILLIAVVNRYRDAPVSRGFVAGFGLARGAIASSVAHDSHNIIVVGTNPDDMAGAVNAVIRASGGLCFHAGERSVTLPLPIAGLMSASPPWEVDAHLEHLNEEVGAAGCALDAPFMALSFLSLLVIPRLRIGDLGLFDAEGYRFVDAVLRPAA